MNLYEARLTDPAEILAYILGGNAIVTLRNAQNGKSFTYKISAAKQGSNYFVSLLNGPDNTTNFVYVGIVSDQKVGKTTQKIFKLTKNSKLAETAPSVIAFKWVFDATVSGSKLPPALEVWRMQRCGHCGRPLTDARSIVTGFGPECSDKLGIARAELPVNGEILRDKASPVRPVSDAEIENAIHQFKMNSPELYFQDGELSEKEAHAVAFMKFKHDLSKLIGAL